MSASNHLWPTYRWGLVGGGVVVFGGGGLVVPAGELAGALLGIVWLGICEAGVEFGVFIDPPGWVVEPAGCEIWPVGFVGCG